MIIYHLNLWLINKNQNCDVVTFIKFGFVVN